MLEAIYSYPYENSFNLNKVKSMLFEDEAKSLKLLFHGAKNEIVGTIDSKHLNGKKDFGAGLYLSESFLSASSWICEWTYGSVYSFYLDLSNLKVIKFDVDRKWMLAILYYRGLLDGYVLSEEVNKIVEEIESADVIVAPIADNQMYDTLNSFALKLISDEQCIHALSANNLGFQYLLKSNNAVSQLKQIDRHYLCKKEKKEYLKTKKSISNDGYNKAQLAISEYRRKGKYIDELFKKC